MDLVIRVPRMPTPGETVLGTDFQTIPGGKGANQAVGAARLGAQVSLIGLVGDDDFGRRLLDNLRLEGVDVSQVGVHPDAATGIAMITLDESGQNSIVVASGANMRLTPGQVAASWETLGKVDVVVMPLEVPLECITQAIELGRRSGAQIVLNPAPAQPLPNDLLRGVDVLVPNESETALLTGESVETLEQAERAGRKLQDRGAESLVMTLGSRGVLLMDGDTRTAALPAHKVNVVDTTAAGDAFVAALAVALSEGEALEQAARMANAAGAIAVTRMGAQPSMPTRQDINELLQADGGEA